MKWIERRLIQRGEAKKDLDLLKQGAPLVFQQLIDTCTLAVEHYRRVAPGVSRLRFEVKLKNKTHNRFNFVSIEDGSDKEFASVAVSLEDDAAIFVDHGKRPILPTFLVELRATAFILTREGRPIEMEEASEIILDALLFPDLLQTIAVSSKG